MKIGSNKDINKDHKKLPVTPPDDGMPTILIPAARHGNLKMLTEKHNDKKLVIILLIVVAESLYFLLLIIFGRKQMASLLSTIGRDVFNELAFSDTNFVFSRLTDHGEEEGKRHDFAIERLQRARDEWNKDQMKRLDFMNKRLREKNEARAYINNADEVMVEYHRVFAKQIEPLPPEPQLSDFYHPSETQKMVNYYLLQWL